MGASGWCEEISKTGGWLTMTKWFRFNELLDITKLHIFLEKTTYLNHTWLQNEIRKHTWHVMFEVKVTYLFPKRHLFGYQNVSILSFPGKIHQIRHYPFWQHSRRSDVRSAAWKQNEPIALWVHQLSPADPMALALGFLQAHSLNSSKLGMAHFSAWGTHTAAWHNVTALLWVSSNPFIPIAGCNVTRVVDGVGV